MKKNVGSESKKVQKPGKSILLQQQRIWTSLLTVPTLFVCVCVNFTTLVSHYYASQLCPLRSWAAQLCLNTPRRVLKNPLNRTDSACLRAECSSPSSRSERFLPERKPMQSGVPNAATRGYSAAPLRNKGFIITHDLLSLASAVPSRCGVSKELAFQHLSECWSVCTWINHWMAVDVFLPALAHVCIINSSGSEHWGRVSRGGWEAIRGGMLHASQSFHPI